MKTFRDFKLSDILWYKIGGIAKFLLEVSNREDVFSAVSFLEKNHIKKSFLIGRGSNLLFSDDYFDGAVIHFVPSQNSSIEINTEGIVDVFSAELLDSVIQFGFDKGLIGLEWAGGLPGTIGAAVRGNVGAFGGEIKDVLLSAEILNLEGGKTEIDTVKNRDLLFSYRNSLIKQNPHMIVVGASFILSVTDAKQVEKAREVYRSHVYYRKTHHPLEYPNCGSVFKNISDKKQVERVLSVFSDISEKVENAWHGKISMGYLINRLGFSGFQIGGAKVSEKHANFIINLGNAKFVDVLTVIEKIQEKFGETFGFVPEVEVEIVR